MNYIIRSCALAISLIFSLSNANIYEHSEFVSVFNYLTEKDYHKNTVVILDIDNTIAIQGHPFQMFGGDMWASYEITKLVDEGYTFKDALAQILPFYFKLTHHVEVKPVEPNTPQIIKQLQDAGITVIACTVRSIQISDRTVAQLKAIGIDLAHSAFGYGEILAHDFSYCYKDGVIFCSSFCPQDSLFFTDSNKGTVLKYILEHFEHTPTKVIVIDDREKYLHQIKSVLHPDVEFIGIRYGHLDEKVANFDPALAEQEKQAYLAAA